MKARLLQAIQQLPVQERIELAEAIWETVAEDADAEALPVSAAHREELDRRLTDLAADLESGRFREEAHDRPRGSTR